LVDVQSKTGLTPLIVAAAEDKVRTIALLLELGAEIDKTDHYGTTALMHAVMGGNVGAC
jgi:ankyrin repeat protein